MADQGLDRGRPGCNHHFLATVCTEQSLTVSSQGLTCYKIGSCLDRTSSGTTGPG